MTKPSPYLEKLTEFARLLRREGLTVGPREIMDGAEALTLLGMEDRETVRVALRAIFAGSPQEQKAFDLVFDRYFVGQAQKESAAKAMGEAEEELARRRAQMEQDLTFNGKQILLREDLKETYVHMPEEEREKLKKRIDRYRDNAERSPSLYDNFIQSIFLRTLMEQQMLAEDAGIGCESDPDADLLYREISSFQEPDIPRAVALISRITQQLSGELSAKRRRGGRSGALDFRRTIRRGLQTGGALTDLRYKKKRKRRRKIVLLCDVSGSMMQFSEFALRFMKSLSDAADNARTFVFSEEIREVDPFALQNMEGFRAYVTHSGCFGKGTDLGSALDALTAVRPAVFGPSTTLLILSDAKTIDLARAERALIRIRHKTGKVVFLNPIPEKKWPYLKGCQALSALCPMISCSTLGELARACRKLLDN
ncbi:MAG: VWA domain-containing protein [Oscillospiraceae bacterium]|nr:VWA domain-containing protein [Oscillospiraceae bacterium]